MPKICVKWGGKKFDVEANTEMEPLVLKSQLYELTGVLPDHQRVLIKGQQLKDDWDGITLQDGLTIMMMGTVAANVAAAKEIEKAAIASELNAQTKAVDDAAKGKEKINLPVGLRNLGNTCYMNACFQAYKTIPELMTSLKAYSGTENDDNRRSHLLISTAKKFYEELGKMEKTNSNGERQIHTPLFLLMAVHSAFPQFAVRDGHGHYQQQDANECFSQVLQIFVNDTNVAIGEGSGGIQEKAFTPRNIKTSRLFETEFDVILKCLESEEEAEQKSHESHMQLSCYLSQDVRYIQSGIKNRFTEEIEKHSATLGRDVKYQKKSLISRLPEYLCVQMVRFFYKQKEQISAKILKDVKFPMNLDIYDVCTPTLQEKFQPMRGRYKVYDDQKVEEMRRSKMDDTPALVSETKDEKKNDEKFWSTSFDDDLGSNNSGFYELKAVITHKGRSSDSGHYVAWVRLGNTSKWAMCDDDEVHPVSEEDVLKLSGGGDWHCAYLLLYGPRALPIHEEICDTAVSTTAVEEKMETE